MLRKFQKEAKLSSILNSQLPRTKRQLLSRLFGSKIEKPNLDDDLSQRRPSRSEEEHEDLIYSLKSNKRLSGYATQQGTQLYSESNRDILRSKFNDVSLPHNSETLRLSSLGYGSYLGDPIPEHDVLVYNSVLEAVGSGGVNVIDTAINYRYMKAERTIGAALLALDKDMGISRDQLFIASKGGFITVRTNKKQYIIFKSLNQLSSTIKNEKNWFFAYDKNSLFTIFSGRC